MNGGRVSVLVVMLALSGCATTVSGPLARCSQLVPATWANGIPSVPLPGFDNVGEVLTAFVDQSARLQMANDRTKDTITIVSNCEKLLNEGRARRKVLGL